MRGLFAAMNFKFDQLIDDRHTNIESGSNNRNKGPRITQTDSGTNGSTTPKVAKLDFPQYYGNKHLTSWVCRVEQFFEFHGINKYERLLLKAYHLNGCNTPKVLKMVR